MSQIILLDSPAARIVRETDTRHQFSLLKDIYVERGDMADWHLLKELHYKAENLPIGPKMWRCVFEDQVIGCAIFSVPKMLLSGRNEVFPHMRPNQGGRDNKLVNRARAVWLNKRKTTNSRLVLDTMFRGAGIAYRFQNIACRMTGMRVIEFQSSMSKYNPFAQRCGFQFIKPKRSAHYEKGLAFFNRYFDSHPTDFVGVMQELEQLRPAVREVVIKKMRQFYFDSSAMEKSGDNRMNGFSRVAEMSTAYLLKQLQQLVFASPLYGIYENPDFERVLPARIPLLAYDNQKLHDPLNLELL